MLIVRFRWVQCHLEHLRTLRSEFDITEALDSLPPGLPATYKAMLDRIGRVPKDLKYTTTALRRLIFFPRPLRANELAVAAVIDSKSEFEDGKRLAACDEILEICGSFVTMDKSMIELAHFSVTEFFKLAVLPDGSTNEYFLDADHAYVLIIKACFSYLNCRRFCSVPYHLTRLQLKELLGDDFYVPASLCWPRLAENHPRNLSISREICRFLKGNGFNAWSPFWYFMRKCHLLNFWNRQFAKARDISLYSPFPTDISITWNPKRPKPSPLYVAANLSLPYVVKMLLDQGESPNEHGGELDYPIFAAVAGDDEDVLAKLLSAGADVSLKQRDGWTPLHDAVMRGSLPITRLLIKWNAH